jgi:hypothetical protein
MINHTILGVSINHTILYLGIIYKSFVHIKNSFPIHDNHTIYSVYLGIKYTSSIYQWEFQDPKLEVPNSYIRLIFQAYVREDPQKYTLW